MLFVFDFFVVFQPIRSQRIFFKEETERFLNAKHYFFLYIIEFSEL